MDPAYIFSSYVWGDPETPVLEAYAGDPVRILAMNYLAYDKSECFRLVDRALAGAGAKSAADFGTVAPDIDYVWGTPVSLADVRPGDIVQFRDYRFDREVVTKKAGETVTDPEQVGPALDRAFAAGVPYLVNVVTDPDDVYPRSSNLA